MRVSAGVDPSIGDRIVLYETVPIAADAKAARERTERDVRREADKLLTRLQVDADSLKAARTKPTLGALLDRWLRRRNGNLQIPINVLYLNFGLLRGRLTSGHLCRGGAAWLGSADYHLLG